jgi:hypothetical protein
LLWAGRDWTTDEVSDVRRERQACGANEADTHPLPRRSEPRRRTANARTERHCTQPGKTPSPDLEVNFV